MLNWLRFRRRPAGRLQSINSFSIYYGISTPEVKRRLATVDLAIVEPRQWTANDLDDLRSVGTQVFGYLSVMETPSWNTKRWAAMTEEMKLTINGGPKHFVEWDAYLMDLRNARYRALLLEEIGWMAESLPLDGILLDTVGDIEDYVPGKLQVEMREAYASLLSVARGRYPQLMWVQNRGFAEALQCAPLLDGFLWEGWDGHAVATPWTRERIALVQDLAKRGVTILASTADSAPIHRERAQQNGLIHWTSPKTGYN
ncbi:hypothetical protein FHS18_000765 [Paenibacillus phyllosphaerae]|uniref:Glycoside-hydrolase family GH114 TIM-barrel domain-containing protein n=1 Tax=Paenibacillus phyllosphaerae TaxID=274593 RepID=A0A7W5AU90_9BACL|nr:glycoside hydrolase family 66 protein [Paenibacillus phyllosphaerae]MBB3108737.1 hypothetical protein [Paenibacillus phyllosphaerae]